MTESTDGRGRAVEELSLPEADVAGWNEPTHPRIRLMLAETTKLRYNIEPEAAGFAAERATEEQRPIISEPACAMHPGQDHVQALFDADRTFHATVLDATGNSMMRQLHRAILAMLRISSESGVVVADGELVTRGGHIRVADAIAAREYNRRTARRHHVADDASVSPASDLLAKADQLWHSRRTRPTPASGGGVGHMRMTVATDLPAVRGVCIRLCN